MKYSIRQQMIFMFAGLMACMLLVLFAINMNFLESYYIRNKTTEFVHMYDELKEAFEENSYDDENSLDQLSSFSETNNMTFLYYDQAKEEIYSNARNSDVLQQQMMGYLLDQAQQQGEIIKSTQEYQISQTKDPRTGISYIEMWGEFNDGNNFLVRSPLESIQTSAEISNRFLIIIGSIVLVIGILIIWFFSRRLTAPIQELTALSDRMANLDFEEKYTSGGNNEIGVLGDNFNRMSEKLESTISELKSANNSLQKDIERKEETEKMRNEFFGNVSHELKTPIALIQGYAEGLKEGVNQDEESRDYYCDVIVDEAQKMNETVKNLLALNELEFGEDEVVFERFDLTELIRGVLSSMEILAQQKEANVIFQQEDPVYVWADELKTEQVLRNYVTNAFNHLDGERVIEVKIEVEDGKARTSVFNTGAPIPEEDIDRIWDKFYKVDKSHTREYGGNGIGLSIVKAIMDSFRQQYGVINYDNGVEFWFELDVK